jgi:hypothetical protein
MRLKFITRRPQPRPATVVPLNDAGLNDAGGEGARPTQGPGRPKELGGPMGPEPTRYGDWERKGICVDF